MRLPTTAALAAALLFLSATTASAQTVPLSGGTYSQNFDTLSNTAGSTTNTALPTGWLLNETGGGARDNEQYAVDTGASNTGDTFSYGAAGSTERALGSIRSGTLIATYGACFTNQSGATLANIDVGYTGEQWRLGTAARSDRLDAQYSLDATSLTTGTWTDIDTLDFTTPNSGGTAGARDGNAAGNRTAIAASINALAIANGASFCLRWVDVDASGADDGLAIDDFTLTAGSATPTLSINDVTVAEGNSGATSATFTVSLNQPAPAGGVTFDIGTADGTATASSDYVAKALSGQSIAAGASTANFTFDISGDTQVEANETLFVNVTNVIGANVADGQGLGTITNDDAAASPDLSINDASLFEGNAGTTIARFTVSLATPAPAGGVRFDIATADGTATAGSDYVARNLAAETIAAGASSLDFDVTINGDSTLEADETFTVTIANVSGATVVDGSATGTIRNDDVALTAIHAIQGNGAQSPLVGTDVTVEGIVTARKSNNGFFLQTAEGEADADPTTSQGIFVFTSSAPPAAAAVGNRVRVFGRVTEFAFSDTVSRSLPITQLASNAGAGVTLSVTLIASGQPLPATVDLQTADLAPGNGPEAMERFEGMRVRAPSLVTVAPTNANISEANATATNGNGVFFATLAGVPRPLREVGLDPDELVATTAPSTVPRFDNNSELLRVDSDGQIGALRVSADAGVALSNLVGVIDYAFNYYSLLPDAGQLQVDAGGFLAGGRAAAAVPTPASDMATVGGFNILRFFDSVNDPLVGEPVLTAAALDRRLTQTTEAICRYVRVPDILGIVEVENLAVLTQLADRINASGAAGTNGCTQNPQYVAYLVEGNDVGGIDVGYLVSTREVRSGVPRVRVLEVQQIGKDALFTNPDASTELLNDRPPLLLRAVVEHPNGASEAFTVINNHMRSLGGASDTAAGSNGWATSGERVRAKRGQQAVFLANIVQQRQTADSNERLLLLGDFNVFEFNDGLVDGMGIVTGNAAPADQVLTHFPSPVTTPLTVLTPLSPRDDRYSFAFDGNAQSLDHAVVNQRVLDSLLAVKAEHARINADFAETRFGTGPLRVSDHDPVVLQLTAASFRSVNLRVAASTNTRTIGVGQSLGWSVDVSSAGETAPGATVELRVDRPLNGLAVAAPGGWTCAPTTTTTNSTSTTCRRDSFASGTLSTFNVSLANSSGLATGDIVLTATAGSQGTEVAATDNAANATVTIVANRAPVFTAGPTLSGMAVVGGVLTVDTTVSDPEGDPLSIAFAWRRNGVPIQGATQASYTLVTPDRGAAIDVEVTARDGRNETRVASNVARIANPAPFAAADSYTMLAGDTLEVPAPGVLGNDSDPDGEVLTARIRTAPSSGTLTMAAAGSFRFVTPAGFSGRVGFEYEACDPADSCATAAVTITVMEPDNRFGLRDDRVQLGENSADVRIDVLANDVVDAAGLLGGRLEIAQAPAFGTATIDDAGTPGNAADDRVRYRPSADRSGEDLLSYRLCERGGRCAEAALQLVVRPIADAALRLQAPGTSGTTDVRVVGFRATRDARITVTPAVASQRLDLALPADRSFESAWDDSDGRRVERRLLPVANVARQWRVLVEASGLGGGDVDLYLGVDSDGQGDADRGELRCVAAMTSAIERCELTLEAPANTQVGYWVMGHAPDGVARTARLEAFEVPVLPGTPALAATGQDRADRLAEWPVRLAWNEPTLLDGERRVAWLSIAEAQGASAAWMPVSIERRGGAIGALAAPQGGLLLPFSPPTLRLAPNEEAHRVFVDVPPGTTRLMIQLSSSQALDFQVLAAPAPTAGPQAPVIAPASGTVISASQQTAGVATMTPIESPPAGRLYLVPRNLGTAVADVTLSVELVGQAPIVRGGSYFNSGRGGHGLFVHPAGNQWAGVWYTFLEDASPTWYYLQGPAPSENGVWRGALFRSTWNGTTNRLTEIGGAVITPTGPDAFTFTYTLDGAMGSEAFSALGRGCPTIGGATLDASGNWFDPARAGSGYSVQWFPNYEFHAVYGYDASGVARFAIAERPRAGGLDETLVLEQLAGFCPLCDRTGTPQRTRVGTLRRVITGGALQSFTVDATFVNGVLGRWVGTDRVQPLGMTQGCAVP